jgi:hypothetical protein
VVGPVLFFIDERERYEGRKEEKNTKRYVVYSVVVVVNLYEFY